MSRELAVDQERLKQARILAADDTPANLLALTAILEQAGYTGLYATTRPQEVLALFRRLRPDLVILDLHMPDLDGFGVLEQLRPEIPGDTYLPVLVVTADDTGLAKQRALAAGAKDFVVKPFDALEIQLRIRHLLETRILHLELQERNRTLDAMVRERTRDLEDAQQQLLQVEQEKKRFYREVIRAVTEDKFHLVDPDEIPPLAHPAVSTGLVDPEAYSALRRDLRQLCERLGLSQERTDDLVLAAGEAITNAIKHGRDGRCDVAVEPDRIAVRITDSGGGIHPEDLPASILVPGFSTKVSLGMGYTMMLRLVDRVWLATSSGGTAVQLEKCFVAPADELVSPLLAAADDDW